MTTSYQPRTAEGTVRKPFKLPASLLARIDQSARELGWTRTRYVATVLARAEGMEEDLGLEPKRPA